MNKKKSYRSKKISKKKISNFDRKITLNFSQLRIPFIFISIIIFIILSYSGINLVLKSKIAKQYFKITTDKYQNVIKVNENLVAYEKNGKWGLMNVDGKIISEPKYERILSENEGLIPAKIKNKWGFIDVNGKIKIDFKFDNINMFKNNISVVCINNKWGVINKDGRYLIKPIYQDIIVDSNNLIQAKLNNKWGLLDAKGVQILPFKYKEIQLLKYNFVVVVKENEKYKIIKIKTREESKEDYDNYSLNIKKYLPVCKNEKWGLLNLDNLKIECPILYDSIIAHEEKCIELRNKDKIHFMFSDGELLNKTFNANSFISYYEDKISIKQNNNIITLIDINNKNVKEIKAEDITFFGKELLGVKNKGKWGLINQDGKYLIEPKYDSLWVYNNEIVAVFLNGKWGLLKINGKLITPLNYNLIGDVKGDYITILQEGKWGVIEKNGQILIKPEFDQITLHSKNYIFTRKGDKWFLIVIHNGKKYFYKFNTTSILKISEKVWMYSEGNHFRVILLIKK